MELKEFLIYLFILSGSTYLIRAVPFAALRKRIENRFVKSFLYYIPYAVLTAMTIPAIFYATDYRVSAAAGLFVSIALAMKGKSLTVVAVAACVAVFLTESVLALLVV